LPLPTSPSHERTGLSERGLSNHFLSAKWKIRPCRCDVPPTTHSGMKSISSHCFPRPHCHLLRGDPASVRNQCHFLLTVLHIMQECSHYDERQTCIMWRHTWHLRRWSS
jgi:hypothetical protein